MSSIPSRHTRQQHPRGKEIEPGDVMWWKWLTLEADRLAEINLDLVEVVDGKDHDYNHDPDFVLVKAIKTGFYYWINRNVLHYNMPFAHTLELGNPTACENIPTLSDGIGEEEQ